VKSRVSYALEEAEDANGARLTNSPAHLVKLNVIAPVLQEKLFAGLELQYTSDRKTLAADEVNGYVVGNFTVFSQDFVKGWEVSASVYNLFDTNFGHPGGTEHQQDIIEQDGRSFRLKLSYRF
jgi:iron complex outermembrane receptor protein